MDANNLSFEYINKNTLWVAKYESGYRRVGNYSEIKELYKDDDIDEIDIVSWRGQPDELKEFYKDYEYANYYKKRNLYLIKDFYKEWIEDKSQFKPEVKPVIGKLSEIIREMDECDDLIINNYDEETAGNHHVGNFIEALETLNIDFDVTEIIDGNYKRVITQTDDIETFGKFSNEANSNAIKHDKYFGDGKYWEEEKER